MIKTYIAYTEEVDDIDIALSEIKSQLNFETNLLKNSIAIIACHDEFLISGLLQGVCKSLPFEVVGAVSYPIAVGEKISTLLLSVMLITSDDVEFIVELTQPLVNDPGNEIKESYKKASYKKEEKPSLILTFAPFMIQNSGDEYVKSFTQISGGVPCFGTLAIDNTVDLSNCFVVYNGEYYSDRMVFVLVYGNISPKFYIASVIEEKVLDKSALITKSSGHTIMEINGHSVDDFFKDLGLSTAVEKGYSMTSLPFLLDYNDGTQKVSKIFIRMTEERYALCAGEVPEGSTLYIAPSNKSDILYTTSIVADEFLKDIENASGMLIYTCISRSMIMGADQFEEMSLIYDKVNCRIPYMIACSGGEICPTQVSNNVAINRFHNNSFIVMIF